MALELLLDMVIIMLDRALMLPLLPPFALPLPMCALPLSLILGIDLNLKFDLLSPL
jgi:hypothetical protein